MTSPNGCTVTTEDGLTLAVIEAGTQGFFVAVSGSVVLSDDSAIKTEVFNSAPIAMGGGGVASSGEPVKALNSSALTINHATWFDNATQSSLAVQPAPWKNAVMTCYLKTAVPVALSGVTWLYGQPSMVEGYTFVIALQQVDASSILANLAYILPR